MEKRSALGQYKPLALYQCSEAAYKHAAETLLSSRPPQRTSALAAFCSQSALQKEALDKNSDYIPYWAQDLAIGAGRRVGDAYNYALQWSPFHYGEDVAATG